jgi:hypothetical protein
MEGVSKFLDTRRSSANPERQFLMGGGLLGRREREKRLMIL